MKRLLMSAMVFLMLVVLISGCIVPAWQGGRDGKDGRDRGHDRDRGPGHDNRR